MTPGGAGAARRAATAGDVRLAIFLMLAAGIVGGLLVYTLTHQRPRIPADADHLRSSDPALCLDCHGPGRKRSRGANHPLNDQCFNCHERA